MWYVVDNEAFSDFVHIKEAIAAWFAAFYVLNIMYPEGCVSTLEFLQR